VPSGLLLGFMVGHRGIEANPAKVNAIRKMAKPSNKKDIMKLTGMMAALGHFISKLSEKGLPFFKLLKKADKFVWDDEAQKAFEALKESLTTPDREDTSSNYWNGDTSLLFGVENQALLSSRCSPETSCYSFSSNSITSKLYLIPRRGWAQRMEMLPTFRESSPSSKHLQVQNPIIWWTNTCPWHGGNVTLQLHSSIVFRCLPPSIAKVLFIAKAAPRATSEVMTLSPRDTGTCSPCMIKGDDITLSDSRRLCRLCINDA
jgi:hypothetical protein